MVTTRFVTGKAKFIRLDVFKEGPGKFSGRRGNQGKQAVEGGIGHPRNYRHGAGMWLLSVVILDLGTGGTVLPKLIFSAHFSILSPNLLTNAVQLT
jgi:hypothetical protein